MSSPPTKAFTSASGANTCSGTIGMPVSNLKVSTSYAKRGAGSLNVTTTVKSSGAATASTNCSNAE